MSEFIDLLLQIQVKPAGNKNDEIEELEKYCLERKTKILAQPEAAKNILAGYASLLEILEESESQSKYSRENYF